MKARDVMTSAVVSVSRETPTSEIAKILRDHAISAMPVVDEAGAPIGMVSEGDLIGRDESERQARLDWWLTLLAEGERLSEDFLASLRASECRAGRIMSAPVITVGEETDITEIARLLTAHNIKRVPVLRDSRIVGIVSRADLVRALAAGPTERTEPNGRQRSGLRAGALAELDRRFRHRPPTAEEGRPVDAPAEPDDTGLMAADFRRLVSDHKGQEVKHRQEQRRAAAAERRHRVAELIDHHVTEESWRGLMHQARLAAERGEKEFMLLRFPSQLCSDGGRAVNAGEPHWPATLRRGGGDLSLLGAQSKAARFSAYRQCPRLPRRDAGQRRLVSYLGRMSNHAPISPEAGKRSRSGLVPCCRSQPIDLDQCRTTGSTSSISGGKAAIGMARVALFQ